MGIFGWAGWKEIHPWAFLGGQDGRRSILGPFLGRGQDGRRSIHGPFLGRGQDGRAFLGGQDGRRSILGHFWVDRLELTIAHGWIHPKFGFLASTPPHQPKNRPRNLVGSIQNLGSSPPPHSITPRIHHDVSMGPSKIWVPQLHPTPPTQELTKEPGWIHPKFGFLTSTPLCNPKNPP